VADGDGLENHCDGNVTVGSNPTPSALTFENGSGRRVELSGRLQSLRRDAGTAPGPTGGE
jgi:hypothetical protein